MSFKHSRSYVVHLPWPEGDGNLLDSRHHTPLRVVVPIQIAGNMEQAFRFHQPGDSAAEFPTFLADEPLDGDV